jgi:hypothetical protein
MPDPGTIVTVVCCAIAALVWLVRLEGRVNSHDREIKDVKEGHETDIQQIRRDVEYIRDRIDRAILNGRA